MSTIWRLNIKPDAAEDVDPRKFCFDKGILGIGWPVDANGPMDWNTYCALGKDEYRDGSKGWRTAANAIIQMAVDDLCWTRDENANYYLGRIAGDWEYHSTDEYRAADIVNVRRCEWFRVGGVDSVPGRSSTAFVPVQPFNAYTTKTSSLYSKIKFNLLSGRAVYDLHGNEDDLELFSLISPMIARTLSGSTCRRNMATGSSQAPASAIRVKPSSS